MRLFIKVIIIVAIVIILLAAVQGIFKFNLTDQISRLFGGTDLSNVRVNVGQEFIIPRFEIVTLEIFYPNVMSVIEADRKEWWRLNIGTVFIFVEYDSYVKLGVRDTGSIKIERKDNTIYVDESSIVIELLDLKLDNYKHIRTFTSNPLVINRVSPDIIFQAQNEHKNELERRMIESGKANFESAKRNFMENYKNMCEAIGLEVVWR